MYRDSYGRELPSARPRRTRSTSAEQDPWAYSPSENVRHNYPTIPSAYDVPDNRFNNRPPQYYAEPSAYTSSRPATAQPTSLPLRSKPPQAPTSAAQQYTQSSSRSYVEVKPNEGSGRYYKHEQYKTSRTDRPSKPLQRVRPARPKNVDVTYRPSQHDPHTSVAAPRTSHAGRRPGQSAPWQEAPCQASRAPEKIYRSSGQSPRPNQPHNSTAYNNVSTYNGQSYSSSKSRRNSAFGGEPKPPTTAYEKRSKTRERSSDSPRSSLPVYTSSSTRLSQAPTKAKYFTVSMLSLKSSIPCDSWSLTYVPATTIFAFETESREGDQAAQARRHARGKEARDYSRRYWEVTNIIKSRTNEQGYTLKLEVREIEDRFVKTANPEADQLFGAAYVYRSLIERRGQKMGVPNSGALSMFLPGDGRKGHDQTLAVTNIRYVLSGAS